MALYKSEFGRELTPSVYRTFAIEDTDQQRLYRRLAGLVEDLSKDEHPLVESITPGTYEDGEYYYTLVVTVSI